MLVTSVLCGAVLAGFSALTEAMQMVVYDVERRSAGVMRERLLAHGQHLRLDDGADAGDHVLYDARAGVVRVVTHATRSVLVIRRVRADPVEPPMALHRRVREQPVDPLAPRIAGVRPIPVAFEVNGRVCAELAILPDLLVDLRTLWRGYLALMAGHHRQILSMVPADLHEPCDLALNLFDGAWWLNRGLPVAATGTALPSRRLVSFVADAVVVPALFEAPSDYVNRELGSLPR